jgi:hypothetical protein
MKKLFPYLIILTLMSIFFACQEKKNGCLDVNATNFDVSADGECKTGTKDGNCPCVYPNLVLGLQYKIAGKNKKGIDTLYDWGNRYPISNDFNQVFFVKNMALYLSDIRLERTDGTSVSPVDSVSIPIKTASDSAQILVKKDFALLSIDRSNHLIGSFKQNGRFAKIKFNIGLQKPVNQANTLNKNKIPNTDLINIDSLYLPKTYEHWAGAIAYQSDTSKVGKINIFKFKNNISVELPLPSNRNFLQGYDVRVLLSVDFTKWFSNVDFTKDSPSTIEQKILANITKGWKVN